MDERAAIKPLFLHVKAAPIDQRFEWTVGVFTQKKFFTLQVLRAAVAKEVGNYFLISDLMGLFTCLLSKENRWLSESLRKLLEKELENENQKGIEAVRKTFWRTDVPQIIAKCEENIRNDLNGMYRQIGQVNSVHEGKFKAIFEEVENRLPDALKPRITPKAIYNRISPPDPTASAADANWNQPLSLFLRSARLPRESLTNAYFPRKFIELSFSEDEFRAAMGIWQDVILKKPHPKGAQAELDALAKIESSPKSSREKCAAFWRVINGDGSHSI